MRKSEFDEQQLEDLLREMPKIKDHREPRDIYQNISLKLQKRKTRSWLVPSIATAAAILLFAVLAPNLMSWNDSAHDSLEESTAADSEKMEMAKIEETPAEFSEPENNTFRMYDDSEENMGMTMMESGETYTALYEIDVENESVFTFAIPDEQVQNIVPISVIVPKEENKEIIELFNETMPKLMEEDWYLSEYYPLNAELSVSEDNTTLNVNVPSGHRYGDGSASEMAFIRTIREVANSVGVERISLYTNNQPGIELGNYGTITDLAPRDSRNFAYYFYYPNENSQTPYLVPYSEPFADIETAIEAMEENIETHSLIAPIPDDIDFKIASTTDENLLTIELTEDSNLTFEPMLIYTIEAILLTAKDFQYDKVKIAYPEEVQVGKFIFNEEWDVPLAPNNVGYLQ